MRPKFEFKTILKPVTLQVKTKCPEKWILIDRETGVAYQGSENGHWDRLAPVVKEAIKKEVL